MIPTNLTSEFQRIAKSNTDRRLETCAILCGILCNDQFQITTLLVPPQVHCNNIDGYYRLLQHDWWDKGFWISGQALTANVGLDSHAPHTVMFHVLRRLAFAFFVSNDASRGNSNCGGTEQITQSWNISIDGSNRYSGDWGMQWCPNVSSACYTRIFVWGGSVYWIFFRAC